MIGVKMGGDDPRHRPSVEPIRENALSGLSGLVAVQPGVDDGPAWTVLEMMWSSLNGNGMRS